MTSTAHVPGAANNPVVVVGASSAGLFAAYLLARQGWSVRIFDQAPTLGPSPRTLIVTDEMTRVLGFVPTRGILHTVHTLELRAGGVSIPIPLRTPDLIVERRELIEELVEKACAAGAQLYRGHRFIGLERQTSSSHAAVATFVRRDDGASVRVPARAVIAADGGRSDVARALGRSEPSVVTVLQAHVSLPPKRDAGHGHVWFLPQRTRYFYWLVPESPTCAVAGIVADDPRNARPQLDGFLVERGMRPFDYQAALIPLYRRGSPPDAQIGQTRVLFVGDAAGHVKVTTVGGTVTGLRGAAAAARAIVHGSDYRRELRSVDRELQLHWYIRKAMNGFEDRDYELVLRLLRGRVGELIQDNNRDRLASIFLSVLAAQPRLLLLAAKGLQRRRFEFKPSGQQTSPQEPSTGHIW